MKLNSGDASMKVATHISDCDGICSAALILRKYPNAEITFWSPTGIVKSDDAFDLVTDLPKPKNAKANVDHHISNYEKLKKEGRLTEKDLVDPTAKSAASLLIRYLGLESDPIAQEIEYMATLADTGHLEGENLILDKLIKSSLDDENFLHYLVKVLAERGKAFIKDPEVNKRWNTLKVMYEQLSMKLDYLTNELKISSGILVIDERGAVPYFMAKDVAYKFFEKGVDAVAMIYNDPKSPEKVRVSIRVNHNCDYVNAREIAESLGGGGHVKAAGILFEKPTDAIAGIVEKMVSVSPTKSIVFLKLEKIHV